ncbi:MAG: hypothetical protein KKC79_09370 [Gammaproteobacteria bacterium]|nr:hypothetical protein [Gammaproteobacteria bacterium]MBU1442797.1 hypothetical protein [Gammaproteobacteria bacterium]MBU2286942.1 hypothetical protein [Gammaproteobacteria bacterium]MBU2408843.1 hypothetical protein [Gammaproteobacteria bacterium]
MSANSNRPTSAHLETVSEVQFLLRGIVATLGRADAGQQEFDAARLAVARLDDVTACIDTV